MAIRADGKITFTDSKSCHLYMLDPGHGHNLLHTAEQGIRYADFCHHPRDVQWVLAIREDHRTATPETQAYGVTNDLVAINTDTGEERVLASGDDFYAHPKFDPSGRYVSWIQWSHPDMPWRGSVLYAAEWDGNGEVKNVRKVAGKALSESIAQPKWGVDGVLYFASDRTGF